MRFLQDNRNLQNLKNVGLSSIDRTNKELDIHPVILQRPEATMASKSTQ